MKQTAIIPLLKFNHAALPFKIEDIKDLAARQDELCESVHNHDYYEIVWMINGKGTLLVDFKEYAIENNTIFCLKPNQAHQFLLNPLMEGFVISFRESFFNLAEYEFDIFGQFSLYQIFNQCQPIEVEQAIGAEIKDLGLKMMSEYENQCSFRTEVLKKYFKIFLIFLSRQFEKYDESVGQSKDTELVKRFMEMLDKNFRKNKMVSDYAAQFFISANHLNRIVKKRTGYSAKHHITHRIVLEAKRMAHYSGSGMKEIAFELGFLDSAHFSRFFKSFTGTNFTDFKKETLNLAIGTYFNRA
jgi:AraC family transcriptional activator of pobA